MDYSNSLDPGGTTNTRNPLRQMIVELNDAVAKKNHSKPQRKKGEVGESHYSFHICDKNIDTHS